MVSITFPPDGITLNFMVEGELDVSIAMKHALNWLVVMHP
jgi:hypothetical protein